MRIAVTGANGQLGQEFADVARARGDDVRATSRESCDITDAAAVEALLDFVRPDALVNCAAWTKVDAAEAHADEAFKVNALGPRVLASACAQRDVLMVHVSTDYVFDGSASAPIDEWQPPSPASVYGRSKLAGETEVRSLSSRHQIVRTSWLYGRGGPNFVMTMRRLAAEGKPLRVVSDQVGSPTWTGHLAPALRRLVQRGIPGTYHLTNSGVTSWFEFARAILATDLGTADVQPISTADYPTPAPRPAYSVLDNRAWRLIGEDPLPHWRDGLAGYLHILRREVAER